jgi:hypothetical protein
MGEAEGSYVWTSPEHDLGAAKNSALTSKKRGNKMTEKKGQQIIGLEILKPNDTTLWKRALKSELGRSAKERKLISGRRARPRLLARILNRLFAAY